MSEFHPSQIGAQTLYTLNTTYRIPKIGTQMLMTVEGPARIVEVMSMSLRAVASPLRLTDVSVMYLRSARIKDMTKPLYVSATKSQTIYSVAVKARLMEAKVLVLQSQADREIQPAPGGLLQTRIY